MDSLHRQVMIGFGQGDRPHESELVLWNGFDQPNKEDAVRFYAGKTWPDVLAHLRGLKDEPVFRGAYFLEEWSVLSPPALASYARPAQTDLLRRIVQRIAEEAAEPGAVEYFGDDIKDAAERVLAEMKKHGS